jgi:hypothetical protein
MRSWASGRSSTPGLQSEVATCASHLDLAVVERERAPLAFGVQEEIQEAGPHRHLLVISGREQLLAALVGQAGGGRPLPQLTGHHGQHQRLEGGIGRIEDDEIGKQRGEQTREGSGERGAGAITLRETGHEPVAVQTGRQCASELLDERGDGGVEDDVRRGLADRLVLRCVADGHDLPRLVEHGDRPDLREVVVVGGDPEDRDNRPARVLREEPRDLDRRHRLVEDVERTAEEHRLLAGDEGGRLLLGKPPGEHGSALGAEGLLLVGERLR